MDIFVLENKKNTIMAKFKVTMTERGFDGKIRTLEQTAICQTKEQVIKFYGLTKPDILDFNIEEVKE